MESSNLTDVEFKTQVIKMLNELLGSVDKFCENFNKEIKKYTSGNENYKREPV